MGRAYATDELRLALSTKTQHNIIDNDNLIIKDSLTAISVVEPVLFSIYKKDNIVKQRPYEAYLIDKYWVISGTLRKGYNGGTFLIIMDSRDSRIIKITHGK